MTLLIFQSCSFVENFSVLIMILFIKRIKVVGDRAAHILYWPHIFSHCLHGPVWHSSAGHIGYTLASCLTFSLSIESLMRPCPLSYRMVDPIILATEASQILKQRLLNFARSLSTMLAIAYCVSRLVFSVNVVRQMIWQFYCSQYHVVSLFRK